MLYTYSNAQGYSYNSTVQSFRLLLHFISVYLASHESPDIQSTATVNFCTREVRHLYQEFIIYILKQHLSFYNNHFVQRVQQIDLTIIQHLSTNSVAVLYNKFVLIAFLCTFWVVFSLFVFSFSFVCFVVFFGGGRGLSMLAGGDGGSVDHSSNRRIFSAVFSSLPQ